MAWLPDGETVLKIMFTRYDRIHERDRQTYTARRHRPRLCIASRAKNWSGEATYQVVKTFDIEITISRFDTISECNRQEDRQTDRIALSHLLNVFR